MLQPVLPSDGIVMRTRARKRCRPAAFTLGHRMKVDSVLSRSEIAQLQSHVHHIVRALPELRGSARFSGWADESRKGQAYLVQRRGRVRTAADSGDGHQGGEAD